MFDSFPLLSVMLPYFHYADKTYELMRSLSKNTQNLLDQHVDALIRYCEKRELELHYPLFKSLAGPLTTNKRNELFKLRMQIKFPDDYDEFEKFITSSPKTEFSHLHLVIIEDSLDRANKVIKLLEEQGTISKNMDETYDKLLASNYCRAANMSNKLAYESEMVIGAEPKAFIDKVEKVGLLDVREVSRCPVEDITFPVYKIKVDKQFCDSLESGERAINEDFKNSVQKAIIEEEVKNVHETLPQHIGNTQKTFENVSGVQLLLTGTEITVEQMDSFLAEPTVEAVEFEGLEEDETVEILSKKSSFAVGDGSGVKYYSTDTLAIEFTEDKYSVDGDFIYIYTNSLNFKVIGKKDLEGAPKDYSGLDASKATGKSYILHKKFLNTLYYKDVPQSMPKVVPTHLLKLYISEKEDYGQLDDYLLNHVTSSLPVHVELDISFTDHMENSQNMIRNLFTRNVQRLEIVQEMQEDEFIDVVYEEVKNSETIKEMVPILNQDTTKDIELIKNATGIEQWIMDVRRPWDEQKDQIVQIFNDCKNNSLVLRDYVEFLIEFRFKTSFQINPIM